MEHVGEKNRFESSINVAKRSDTRKSIPLIYDTIFQAFAFLDKQSWEKLLLVNRLISKVAGHYLKVYRSTHLEQYFIFISDDMRHIKDRPHPSIDHDMEKFFRKIGMTLCTDITCYTLFPTRRSITKECFGVSSSDTAKNQRLLNGYERLDTFQLNHPRGFIMIAVKSDSLGVHEFRKRLIETDGASECLWYSSDPTVLPTNFADGTWDIGAFSGKLPLVLFTESRRQLDFCREIMSQGVRNYSMRDTIPRDIGRRHLAFLGVEEGRWHHEEGMGGFNY